MRGHALPIGVLVGVLLTGGAIASPAGDAPNVRDAELRDLDVAGKLEVLDLASNKIFALSLEEAEGIQEEETEGDKAFRARLAKMGDIYFEKIARGSIIVGSKTLMKFEEDEISGLAGQDPSKLVHPAGMLPVSPEDFLLVRMIRGGYALVCVRERTKERLKLAWIVNGGGDKPFAREALAEFLGAVSRDKKKGK